MNIRSKALLLLPLFVLSANAADPTESPLEIEVYKDANCGCCKNWVKHLEENGFTVKSHDVDVLTPYKERAKLGAGLGSCHTAFIDGYAIEGHVPADDIRRLIKEGGDVSGLTVPRMPAGSPGMEMPGQTSEEFDVLSYKDGEVVEVFTNYPAGSEFKN